MRQYPIWVDVESCVYKSDKSYGIKSTGKQKIFVGTSKRNSHLFTKVEIQKTIVSEGTLFSYFVDDVLIKESLLTKDGFTITKGTGEINV